MATINHPRRIKHFFEEMWEATESELRKNGGHLRPNKILNQARKKDCGMNVTGKSTLMTAKQPSSENTEMEPQKQMVYTEAFKLLKNLGIPDKEIFPKFKNPIPENKIKLEEKSKGKTKREKKAMKINGNWKDTNFGNDFQDTQWVSNKVLKQLAKRDCDFCHENSHTLRDCQKYVPMKHVLRPVDKSDDPRGKYCFLCHAVGKHYAHTCDVYTWVVKPFFGDGYHKWNTTCPENDDILGF